MHRALSIVILGLASGCASMFMHGGKLVDSGYKPTVQAKYTLQACKDNNGGDLKGPDAKYLVVDDGESKGLFEKSPDGTGAVITNHWSASDGDHYFGWVQSSGWEYIIPKSPEANGTRVIYVGLETQKDGEITKPTSKPVGRCDLVPEKS